MPVTIHTKPGPRPSPDPASVIKAVQDAAREEGRAQGRAEMSDALAEVVTLLEAAHAKLSEMAALQSSGIKQLALPTQEAKTVRRKRAILAPIRPGTDQARVLEIVRAVPGLKGAQIAQQLPNSEERTIRTSLRRLKLVRGLIEQREDGGWYPVEGKK